MLRGYGRTSFYIMKHAHIISGRFDARCRDVIVGKAVVYRLRRARGQGTLRLLLSGCSSRSGGIKLGCVRGSFRHARILGLIVGMVSNGYGGVGRPYRSCWRTPALSLLCLSFIFLT